MAILNKPFFLPQDKLEPLPQSNQVPVSPQILENRQNQVKNTEAASTATVWEVSVCPSDTNSTSWRNPLLERLRPALKECMRRTPDARDFSFPSALGSVQVRLKEGTPSPSLPFRLAFAPNVPALSASPGLGFSSARETGAPLAALRLPDDVTQKLGQRLVGLENAQEEVLLRWGCQWDGGLFGWSSRTGCPVPPALSAYMQESHGLTVFHGDPGTGKSALARVVGDAYCRLKGIPGTALYLSTEARGEGLVGQFSQRVRAAFDQLRALPAGTLRLLIIDELDALAVRRSEAQAHQEDRAATAALLQLLDAVAGTPRLAVIATTNRLDALDPALVRRAHCVAFDRPDQEAREALLAEWMPAGNPLQLKEAAGAADGLTPADMEQTLARLYMAALSQGQSIRSAEVIRALSQAPRTQAV